MSARSRRKGAAWEVEVARRFREAGIPAERNLTECRTGNAGDIDLPEWCPLLVQAKVGALPPIWQAIREAEEAAGPGQHPVAIVRRNGSRHQPPVDLAIMRLDEWLDMVAGLRVAGWW